MLMKIRSYFFAMSYLLVLTTQAQDISGALAKAFASLEKDPQMVHGIAALYVVDVNTGAIVFNRNGHTGLAPASAQKVVTAATALELLGSVYRYTTLFGYEGPVVDGVLKGAMLVKGTGDPTLGSARFPRTKPAYLERQLKQALKAAGIQSAEGGMRAVLSNQESYNLPGGWIWEDVANYYGAGHGSLNWNENLYDLWLKPGREKGDPVQLRVNQDWTMASVYADIRGRRDGTVSLAADSLKRANTRVSNPALFRFDNLLSTGPRGSGDQAFVFIRPGEKSFLLQGTVPCCVDSFRIQGSIPDPDRFTLDELARVCGVKGVRSMEYVNAPPGVFPYKLLMEYQSPALDSIVYWFLQKSINLYGEALVHTLAMERSGFASYEPGLRLIRNFWKDKGIDTTALNIVDGSGLSPQNRVTAKALTEVMRYSHTRTWYPAFYAALPVFNGVKMKSGTIRGVKSYTGYVKNKSGREYAFAIIVNNFAGSASLINQKMFAVLDVLK